MLDGDLKPDTRHKSMLPRSTPQARTQSHSHAIGAIFPLRQAWRFQKCLRLLLATSVSESAVSATPTFVPDRVCTSPRVECAHGERHVPTAISRTVQPRSQIGSYASVSWPQTTRSCSRPSCPSSSRRQLWKVLFPTSTTCSRSSRQKCTKPNPRPSPWVGFGR